jgi:hypothetical protein
MALRKEAISVALLGLVRRGYKRDVVGLIDCQQFYIADGYVASY